MTSKARLVITAVVVEKQPVAQVVRDYGCRGRGSMSCSPATAPKARWRSNHVRAGPGPRRAATAPQPSSCSRAAQAARRAGPRRRRRHHRLAPRPPPRPRPCRGPRSTGSSTRHAEIVPDPVQAAPLVLHRLRGRPAQRVLAVRLHPPPPAPAARMARDHHLARRPLPLRAERDRPPADHRRDRGRHLRRRRCSARVPGLDPDRQRHGLHRSAGLAPRRAHRPGTELRRRGIVQKNSRPNHPTTCGKVERFQQTLKNWLRANPGARPRSPGYKPCSSTFVEIYNQQRPHRSLPHRATPATAYAARRQGRPRRRPHRRHPRPRPHRQDRQIRDGHPARRRASTPHRRRTSPRRNPRPAARPRPPRADRRRRHRRTPARAGDRHHPRLPAPTPTDPEMTNARTHATWVRASGMS